MRDVCSVLKLHLVIVPDTELSPDRHSRLSLTSRIIDCGVEQFNKYPKPTTGLIRSNLQIKHFNSWQMSRLD